MITRRNCRKLEKELAYTKGFLDSVMKKLSNEKFVNNAPAKVLEMEQKKKTDAEIKIKSLEEHIANLKAHRRNPCNLVLFVLALVSKVLSVLLQGASLCISQIFPFSVYSNRSCSRFSRPCQNSNKAGISLYPPQFSGRSGILCRNSLR